MSCQCGKRLYGKDVEAEYKRQKKDYDGSSQESRLEEERREVLAQAERKRRHEMRAAMAYRAEFDATRKSRADGDSPEASTGNKPVMPPPPSPADVANTIFGHTPHPAILPSTLSTAVDNTAPVDPLDEENICAWHNCVRGSTGGRDIRRKNSKYCSRACSNANARWRFKQRKKDGDE
jgi:hypothetical protein